VSGNETPVDLVKFRGALLPILDYKLRFHISQRRRTALSSGLHLSMPWNAKDPLPSEIVLLFFIRQP